MKPRETSREAGASTSRPTPSPRLDGLPASMAGPVLNSLIRSAATAASREMAHALFTERTR